MSNIGDMLQWLLTDRRTPWQKFKDMLILIGWIMGILAIPLIIGLLIGKFCL
jgi:hypothetical protein